MPYFDRTRWKAALLACSGASLLFVSPASGQQVDPNKLLELMVQEGLVSREKADRLISEATVSAPPASVPQVVAGGAQGDAYVVPYIPAPLRAQLKEEVKAELATRAQAEGWAQPGETPEWTRRIALSGDVRARGEGVLFGEDNGAGFLDYQAINRQGGFDFGPNHPFNPPFLNTTEDRSRLRVRARLAVNAKIDDNIFAELRVGTGNDNDPVSPNQTLGGGGAELGKYAIWLDRANIRLTPLKGMIVDIGRAENPFRTTSLMFDPDLNFDGGSIRYERDLTRDWSLFGAAGAFPIYNTAFNFSSNDVGAFESRDKWLGAAQAGATWQATPELKLSSTVGYFHFGYLQAKLGDCPYLQDVCPTDVAAFQFSQFGNTVVRLRRNGKDPADPAGSPDPQLLGLASKFRVLQAHGRIDYRAGNDLMLRLDGEYVRNLSFDRSDIGLLNPENNLEGNNYFGGDDGWHVNLIAGRFDGESVGDTPRLSARNDWFASVGYKFLQSDAVPDAFTDSDFHGGGTNAQGFVIGAGWAFGHNTSLNGRWLSAQEASGDIYKVDLLQLDLVTRF